MAAVERLPVLLHSADYIIISFGTTGHIAVALEGVLLMYTVEGVSSVANFIISYEESQ